MVKIQNSDAIKAIRDAGRLSISEGFPQELKNDIQAVIDMTPEFHINTTIVKSATLSNATAQTIFTTDALLDTYITGVMMTYIKDVTSTATSLSCESTSAGANILLARFVGLTLTPAYDSIFISFDKPIKLDKNVLVRWVSDTNVANIKIMGVVYGFTVSP